MPIFDIIIPVHNAIKSLRVCVDSILSYSFGEDYRLLLINDGSDEITTAYLNTLPIRYSFIEVLNLCKQGYLKAINQGVLKYRTTYKICLNSDTVVTVGWLTKLRQCAESDISIGLISVLTNNGYRLSVLLPPGYSFWEVNEIIKNGSKRLYPDTPAVYGYCLLITQALIDKIGGFDEVYNPGYYEEWDYQYRAHELGFRAVICDDLYIFHQGNASFQDEALVVQLIQKNKKTFLAKWGKQYMAAFLKDLESSPLEYIFDSATRLLKLKLPETPFDILFFIPVNGTHQTSTIEMANKLILEGMRVGVAAFWPQSLRKFPLYTMPLSYRDSTIRSSRIRPHLLLRHAEALKKSFTSNEALAYLPKRDTLLNIRNDKNYDVQTKLSSYAAGGASLCRERLTVMTE